MHDDTTTKTIIERATKAMQRRNRDGKPFRPVQDPLIQLAADLQDKNDRQAAEIERLKAELNAVVAAYQHDYAKPSQPDPTDEAAVEAAEA